MDVELKPCPFCGSSAVQVEQPSTHRFSAYCNQAEGGCSAEGALRSTREAAITAWNRRHGAGDAEDAARYRWLRAGDNDELVIQRQYRRVAPFLLRGEKLDAAIDAARAGERGVS